MEFNSVYLLTGSNIGNSIEHLQLALHLIGTKTGEVEQASSLYKTAPWGNTNQQHFYNQVICLKTTLNPWEVLQSVLGIELEMGRKRDEKWGPRIIDIDILFFNDQIIDEEQLKIPHPYLHQRRFTLEPLNEIAGGKIHPVFNKTISTLLKECEDSSLVEKL